MTKLILTGDINLMSVTDAALPFAKVGAELRSADFVFSNLECCLFESPLNADGQPTHQGYFASPKAGGDALKLAGIHAVGMANNVNLGSEPILGSIARLDELKILHTGAGKNAAAARAPVIAECNGVRLGILQRTSVYWANGHEAKANLPGVAVMGCNTAYQVPEHRTRPGMTLFNRPGLPPTIVTWVQPPYLKSLKEDIAALRAQCDIVIASCHWGYHEDVLDYMPEWAHAAVDAGADIVLGHGPHYVLPVEVYQGKPIFYGLGSFSFNLKGDGTEFGEWVGALARLSISGRKLERVSLQFVRHNENNQTFLCSLADETAALNELKTSSQVYGTRFETNGDEVVVTLG